MTPPLDETRSAILVTADKLELRYLRTRLLIEAGPDRGRIFELAERAVVLGRGDASDLVLSDGLVSRRHLRIWPDGRGWRFEDLGSKGGVFLGDVAALEGGLTDGARLRLGETVLVFRSAQDIVKVPVTTSPKFAGLLGESRAMRELFTALDKVAPLSLPVLLLGESGTGKEGIAGAIAALGGASRPYEIVDCTLLDREHLRSELFGHVKGAFTGASSARPGAFERADGGTLFLDEVGELPLHLQPALLRVLEYGQVKPLGGTETVSVQVRIVAATHRDLEAMVAEGTFRADLYYRLSALALDVPPLRDREGDIGLLAHHFAGDQASIDDDALQALRGYPWPGNVRQLRNVVQRAVVMGTEGRIRPEDLRLPEPTVVKPPPADRKVFLRADEDTQREILKQALARHQGNRKAVAEELGVERTTLWRRIKKFGLE